MAQMAVSTYLGGVLFVVVLVLSALPFGVYIRAPDFWLTPI